MCFQWLLVYMGSGWPADWVITLCFFYDSPTALFGGVSGSRKLASFCQNTFQTYRPYFTAHEHCSTPITMTATLLAGDWCVGIRAPVAAVFVQNALRFCVVMVTAFVVLAVPNFANMMALVGATCCTTLALILPGVFHLNVFAGSVSSAATHDTFLCVANSAVVQLSCGLVQSPVGAVV